MGLLNYGAGQPPAGLLGKYYDPAEEKRQKIVGAMSSAGAALLQGGQGNFGQVLGQALAGANQGQQNAGINYRQDAMGYNKLAMDMENQQYTRGRQQKEDAWTNTERQYTLEQRQQEDEQKQAQKAAIMEWAHKKGPGFIPWAENFPEQAAQLYASEMMPKAGEGFTLGEGQHRFDAMGRPIASGPPKEAKPPTVETFYDERTGQTIKEQWNPQTQKWERHGGAKADENGITITNPDGTTTQIGGSGAKTTEADRRAKLLAEQTIGSAQDILANFESLATLGNTVGTNVPGGRGVMSGQGQVADDALKNIVANWLYLTSGATANPGEVITQVAMLKPTVLDKPEAIAAKKARLQAIVDSMKIRGGLTTNQAPGVPLPKKAPVAINGYTIQEE